MKVKKKKKIAILTLHLNYGGVELASINLANMLKDEYDVSIVNMYKSEIPFQIDNGINLIQLSNLTPNKQEFKEALKRKNIFKIFKEGFTSIKILKLRTRLVEKHLLENDYDIIISSRALYTKLLNNLNKNCVKIAIEHRHHNNDEKYIRFLEKNTNNITTLVSVSKELADFYKKRCNCESVFIPNAIENIPDERALSSVEKENLIIAVGRLEKEKGFLDLIDVFEKINIQKPEYKLIIAGDGSLKEDILKKIEEKNLQEKVSLTGFIPKNKLNKLYNKSKIYLMTSFEESFGLVAAEAQSYKIPVITFSSAKGVIELLNGTGIVVQDRNIEKMADEVIDLLNNEKEYNIMSEASFKNAQKFSLNNVKEKWLKLLEKNNK